MPDRLNSEETGVNKGDECRRPPYLTESLDLGHGRRRKQAHDEYHDRIWIHRGCCVRCGMDSHLSLLLLLLMHITVSLARSQALQRRLREHRTWEKALPRMKD